MKPIKRFLSEGNITFYQSDKEVLVGDYVEKDEELRGIWFSTVGNIDLPKIEDVESYKAYLRGVIDKVVEYNMNTVIFQVRPSNDALYESDLAPWSRFITGEEGKYPGFDVFGYFIEEAKKKGITVHAWLNPYRVSTTKFSDLKMTKDEYINTLDPKNFARKRPDLVIETAHDKLILDPASEEVQDFVAEVSYEIASKYDVKAIHMDDYFYPYEPIRDPLEEEKFKKSGIDTLANFRRHNVNMLIKKMHEKLKTLPRKVEFGISPFGIYRTNSKWFTEESESAWEKGSNNHHSCYNCYTGLFADVYLWMKEGWMDYIVPQNYFELDYWKTREDGTKYELVKYADLAEFWSRISKETNIKLYMGQGLYRYTTEGNWSNSEEIINQLKVNQNYDNVKGVIFFTYRDLVKTEPSSLVEAREKLKKTWTKKVKEI